MGTQSQVLAPESIELAASTEAYWRESQRLFVERVGALEESEAAVTREVGDRAHGATLLRQANAQLRRAAAAYADLSTETNATPPPEAIRAVEAAKSLASGAEALFDSADLQSQAAIAAFGVVHARPPTFQAADVERIERVLQSFPVHQGRGLGWGALRARGGRGRGSDGARGGRGRGSGVHGRGGTRLAREVHEEACAGPQARVPPAPAPEARPGPTDRLVSQPQQPPARSTPALGGWHGIAPKFYGVDPFAYLRPIGGDASRARVTAAVHAARLARTSAAPRPDGSVDSGATVDRRARAACVVTELIQLMHTAHDGVAMPALLAALRGHAPPYEASEIEAMLFDEGGHSAQLEYNKGVISCVFGSAVDWHAVLNDAAARVGQSRAM